VIHAKSLSFRYSHDSTPTLQRINFEVQAGEFVLVTGPTGSGKSTLLKALIGLAPHFTGGQFSGEIEIDGLATTGLPPHDVAHLIGYVNQQPEGAFATDTVEEELAYGMEQLGVAPDEMRLRVQNIATLVGVDHLLKRPLERLSGGQQQRVAIGSALAAGQKILLLDEPTSALDDKGTQEVLQVLKRLTREEKLSVIVTEHRVERLTEIIDRIFELRGDGLLVEKSPSELRNSKVHEITTADPIEREYLFETPLLELKYGNITAIHPISLRFSTHSITSLSGDNGSGKSSLLWCVLREAWRQKRTVAMVPQNASDLLILNTVSAELTAGNSNNPEGDLRASNILERLIGRLDPTSHPRDLSVGQQLALALALQISRKNELLLLDEPTRGLDADAKSKLAELLIELRSDGHAILLATHDHVFARQISDEDIHLIDGRRADEN
jgi:energy-coupling factor transporter ATP-binding protein EcfA2